MNEALSQPDPAPERMPYWIRAFRPFFIWLVISIVALSWEYHRVASPRTTLSFEVLVEGKPLENGGSASIGNRSLSSGNVVPIGWRTLHVYAPDCEPVRKKVFIWYGENNIGAIDLKRSYGGLDLVIDPTAKSVEANGPYFAFSLTNSTGTNVLVPVGAYRVKSTFDQFSDERECVVTRNETNRSEIKFGLGAVAVSSEPEGAPYSLVSKEAEKHRVGLFGSSPRMLTNLPEGSYQLRMWRDDYELTNSVDLIAGKTNHKMIRFVYGDVRIESEPAGAGIYRGTIGVTHCLSLEKRDIIAMVYRWR